MRISGDKNNLLQLTHPLLERLSFLSEELQETYVDESFSSLLHFLCNRYYRGTCTTTKAEKEWQQGISGKDPHFSSRAVSALQSSIPPSHHK